MSNNDSQNYFLHADGDSFFVACELTKRPDLKGRAVVVGEDRGIAVAMSSEAKKLGVTRGMPVFKIKKLYPEVVILSHHFDLYREISRRAYEIMISYLEHVEIYSVDECFAIVKHSDVKYFGGAEKLVHDMKEEITQTLGVTYSFGLARTKALAKLASKLQKPNGAVLLLSHEDEIRALQKTSIDDIWGIGRKTIPRLKNRGLHTAYDFVHYLENEIKRNFSEPLVVLQKELSGISIMQVHDDTDPREQKSIQSTSTFRPPSADEKVIQSEIAENAEHACANARKLNLLCNKVSFFVKTNDFKYYAHDVKLSLYTADSGVILNIILPLLPKVLMTHEKIRSTGVILHDLVREENVPRDLFGTQQTAIDNLSLEKVMDGLRKKFGWNVIKRASSVKKRK